MMTPAEVSAAIDAELNDPTPIDDGDPANPENAREVSSPLPDTAIFLSVDAAPAFTPETASMGSMRKLAAARMLERSAYRRNNGVVIGDDDERTAALGSLMELPTMGEVLAGWMERIKRDACQDLIVPFAGVLLNPEGSLSPGDGVDPTFQRCEMTYRSFGNLIRDYCAPPRNSARNLIDLPAVHDGPGHTGVTARTGGEKDSPRSIAYNARLDKRKAADAIREDLTGEERTTVIFRTRKLDEAKNERTVIGVVTPTHSLTGGDDDKLITALTLAFAGHANTGRAAAYRGIEESEIRVVLPTLTIAVPGTGSQRWFGYVTARNSESGAKSWNISAGLYRVADGASVAVEAITASGRHVGQNVPARMVEVANGAAELLSELMEKAAQLATREWKDSTTRLLADLRASLAGTALHEGDVCCGIAFELGRRTVNGEPVTVGMLMDVLGVASGACARRVDARPIEVMMGRVLLRGWEAFKSAAEKLDDGSAEE